MLGTWLLLITILAGHACMIVYSINVFHGLGFAPRWLDFAVLALLAILGLATLGAAYWMAKTPWTSWPIGLQIYGAACLLVALVGLPVSTAMLALRRRPPGVSGAESAIDLTRGSQHQRADFVGASPSSRLHRLPGNQSLDLNEGRWGVEIGRLPLNLNGLEILHLSDLHLSPAYDRRYYEAVLKQAASATADIVVVTGDIVDHPDTISWIEPLFGTVDARLGRFALLGNHDRHYNVRALYRALRRSGITILEARWTRLERDGATIALGGTSAPWGKRLDLAKCPEADIRIVLSHSPDQFNGLARGGVDLVLAGHNHGGQVRFPVLGPVVMPSIYGRRFDRGFFRAGKTLMHVSQGIGSKVPVRYGCPPEITRLTLRAPIIEQRATSARTQRAQLA